MTSDETKQAARSFLKAHRTGVLATLAADGTPHARPVYYASDDAFNIYFLTLANTRKADEIRNDPRAAFVVSAEDVPQMLQVEGTIEDKTESAILDPVVSELFKNLQSNSTYYAPLTRFDAAKVVFYCLTPSMVRWGDFTSGHTTAEVLTEFGA